MFHHHPIFIHRASFIFSRSEAILPGIIPFSYLQAFAHIAGIWSDALLPLPPNCTAYHTSLSTPTSCIACPREHPLACKKCGIHYICAKILSSLRPFPDRFLFSYQLITLDTHSKRTYPNSKPPPMIHQSRDRSNSLVRDSGGESEAPLRGCFRFVTKNSPPKADCSLSFLSFKS